MNDGDGSTKPPCCRRMWHGGWCILDEGHAEFCFGVPLRRPHMPPNYGPKKEEKK